MTRDQPSKLRTARHPRGQIRDSENLYRDTALRGIGAILLICVVGCAFVFSYVGALHDPKPDRLPVSVVGPPRLIDQIEAGGSFEADVASSPEAATRALDENRVYASLIATPSGAIAVTTAPAAGVAATDVVEEGLVPALRKNGTKVTVTQVHQLGSEDARGLAGFYLAVGWTVAGYLGATFLGLIFTVRPALPRTEMRLAAIGLLGILIGLLGAGTVHLMGALEGSVLAAAGVGAVTVLAVGAATVALQSAFGLLGTGGAILIFVVLGNPSSSGPVPNQMLPAFWRAIGPYIPIGAAVEILRNISYFPAADNLAPLLVLVAWAAVASGAALALGSRNQRFRRAEEEIDFATSE